MSEESSTFVGELRTEADRIEALYGCHDLWANLMREAASIIEGRGGTVELLERFRERCAEEGDEGQNRNDPREGGDRARIVVERIREIDVGAWLCECGKPSTDERGECARCAEAADNLAVVLDVSNQQLAEIRAMVGDGPAAETVRRALAAKDAEIERRDAAVGACLKERDDLLEYVESLAGLLGCNEEWTSVHDHRLCIKQAVMWGTGGEERVEVRKIVEAREGESTPDAVNRALRYLFDTAHSEMKKMADIAAESIDENMRVGAKGMRNACAQIAGALSKSPNAFVAATSTGIRQAIEALPIL